MEVVALALGALLAVACVVFVARPFSRAGAADDASAAPTRPSRSACGSLEERDRALAALKELEFDHRTGKISDEDYAPRGPLRREAAEALRALEPVAPPVPAGGEGGRSCLTARTAGMRRRMGAASARMRAAARVEGETEIHPPAAGLWPPDPFLIISGALVIGAIVLFVAAVWAWGVVALLAAAMVFLGARAEERRPAKYALGGVGASFTAGRDSFAARSSGQIELFRARRERAELEGERTRTLPRLGVRCSTGTKRA